MNSPSRTPEGDPNRCPVCGARWRIEPSRPAGDAPCPSCGTLIWFEGERSAASMRGTPAGRPKSYFRVETPRKPTGRDDATTVWPPLHLDDRVRVLSGVFVDMVGRVTEIDRTWGRVVIEVALFGQSVPVECERNNLEPVAETT
jgi:hypothetical protein